MRTKNEMLSKTELIQFVFSMELKLLPIKSYQFSCSCRELTNYIKRQQSVSDETTLSFKNLQHKLHEKSAIIKKLGMELAYYEDHPSKQQFGYISQLQAKAKNAELQVKKLQSQNKEHENNQQYMTQYNNMLVQKVQEMRIKLYQYQIEQFSTLGEVQKNSELKEFQNNVQMLKDLVSKGALKMSAMNQQYSKIQNYNQQLLGQRSVLAKRAAVGFAQLTPRPNYKNIFKDNGLDFQKMIPIGVKPSTEQLVISLIKKFKEFYHKYVGGQIKLEVIKNDEQVKIKRDPGGPILQNLNLISKQIRKVQNLSNDVRSNLNKQKQQKQQINKRNSK